MRSHMQDAPIVTESASAVSGRQFRYYDFVMAAFVAILLLSNLIGAAKLADVGGFIFGAGILFFPLGYVIGDVLTEVMPARAESFGPDLQGLCSWRS
jgi:queuosine precursor transporter